MTEVDRSTDDLLIEIQDELMPARFRFQALKLIFKSFNDGQRVPVRRSSTSQVRSLVACRSSSARWPRACRHTRNRPDSFVLMAVPGSAFS